jgi:amino acid adenylation domain-containing protein
VNQIQESGEARIPLSFNQEQLWFVNSLAPERATYNVLITHRLTGALDLALLRTSLTSVVGRHEVLRGTVHEADGAPYLVVSPPAEVELTLVDLSELGAEKREAAVSDALAKSIGTPFQLDTGPLHRYTLIRLAPTEHIFSQVYHHIIIDGWSADLLNAELAATYAALQAGQPQALPEPSKLQYGDYVRRQREQLAAGELDSQLDYWHKRLAALPLLELPADRARGAEQSFAGNLLSVELPADLLSAARGLAQQAGVSLSMVLSAGLAAVLARYTGQDDIAFGLTTLGRTDPELEQLIGYFTNMVVLRTDLADDPSFADLLDQVADNMADAYDNEDVPFELVVNRVQPVRHLGRNPLFVVAMQLLDQRVSASDLPLPGVQAEPVAAASPVSRFDLTLNFIQRDEGLLLNLEYSVDLFDPWRVQAFANHLVRLLTAACADPGRRVSDLPLLSDSERDEILTAGRGEELSYGPEPVHAMVARVAAAQPDHLAAVFEDQELTYAELDRKAGVLARYLRANDIGHEQIVAVAMERDLDALVALLGVLKAGAAYAVLDPTNPTSRLEYMLGDTATPLVLTQSRLRERLPESDARRIIELDSEWAAIESATPPEEPLAEWADRDSLAYVLYTSGSTGQPKGVLIDHRALVSFTESYRRLFDLVPSDRMLQLAALSFDMSQGEIFAGLCSGSTLVLVDREAGTSPDALAALIRSQRTSYICMSPAMLSLVESGPYPDLRKIMAGGEAVPAEMVNKWNQAGRRMINVYGPTEAAVGCTSYECPHVPCHTPPPIGKPFPDRRMYVVDRWGNLLPRGVPGELLIGGVEGLARGYLKLPEITAALFTEDPFLPGSRIYRSGDMVSWNQEYQLEFHGRLDGQVKLRGLRIELEEIETALSGHRDVTMAAVALRKDRRGEPQLVGYVTIVDGAPRVTDELKRHLLDRLPAYMVPSAWVVLDQMPLTTARKVNRAALPDPVPAEVVEEFITPATPTEQAVADIFAEVLVSDHLSVESDFFDSGGNSLLAMQLVSRLNKRFGIKFTVRKLFGIPTVRGVASAVEELLEAAGKRGTEANGA